MEHEIIEKIEYILAEKLGWGVNFFETESNNTPMTFDGQMQITTEHGDFNLFCEIKKSVLPSSIPSLKETIDSLDIKNQKVQGAIILAHYISTNAREILHQKNLNYADTGGNIFIRDNTFHVYIETGQSDRSALTSEAGRAFTNAGLKVLYQFFRSDERRDLNDSLVFEGENSHGVNLNSSYSNIALQASVSKDTVSKVIQDLLEQGYILRKNSSEYKWKEKKVTFERWVSRINEIMRPSLNQKKYRFIGDPIVPENIPSGYQIGGYYGAQIWLKLTPSQEIITRHI